MTSEPSGAPAASDAYQAGFERRWGHLAHPHVRALAWLLDAPDLLDAAAPSWQGRIATLGPVSPPTAAWLAALDGDPAPLDAALGPRPYSRLGLYAEKLMAFYFAEQGQLVAHGLQVRASRNDTVGEFDFLLRDGGELAHIELATKFYLLDSSATPGYDGLIGPNLADTLGLKLRKIFDHQLALARHPAAQALLPQPVARAQALVRGWLFYPMGGQPSARPGISAAHCSGFWISLNQAQAWDEDDSLRYMMLPRLQWLAPYKTPAGQAALNKAGLLAALADQLARTPAPVMVAVVRETQGWWVEQRRGFVVPDDWQERAAQRRLEGKLPA